MRLTLLVSHAKMSCSSPMSQTYLQKTPENLMLPNFPIFRFTEVTLQNMSSFWPMLT